MLFVLDLDDTLYLERDYVRSGFSAVDRWVQEKLELTGFFEKAWQLFLTGARGRIFNQALSEMGVSGNGIIDSLVSLYRSHKPSIVLEPDAAAFLKLCQKQNLAIITDGYSIAQWAKINALGLKDKVEQVIVTGDWGTEFWKPHPRAFEYVSKNRKPNECIYIADNPTKDFDAPEKLGWATSVRIRRPNSLHYGVDSPTNCVEITSFLNWK